MEIFNGSVKYLCGRGRNAAIIVLSTIFAVDDFADRLRADPTIHTIKFEFLLQFPDDLDWWRNEYRKTLLEYDVFDPQGQAKARQAANDLYLANRDRADAGAKVSWDWAFDESTTISAIQAAMNNYLSNEEAFWAQDQNSPRVLDSSDDIRAKSSYIATKQHPEGRRVVPSWVDHLVAHIDCHDSLLFWSVVGGSSTMQAAMVDRQTWPLQKQTYFTLRNAPINFETDDRYRHLPTVQDKIRAAIDDLVAHLLEQQYMTEDGRIVPLAKIGCDASDGDHWATIQTYAAEKKSSVFLPMRGIGIRASHVPMNARPKGPTERRRGDHWIERVAERTKTIWLECDANYFKSKLHRGLKAPLGTSESFSLYHSQAESTHHLTADHCNAETATWVEATKANESTNGVYEWKLKPNKRTTTFSTTCAIALRCCLTWAAPGSMRSRRRKQFRKWLRQVKFRKLGGAKMQCECGGYLSVFRTAPIEDLNARVVIRHCDDATRE